MDYNIRLHTPTPIIEKNFNLTDTYREVLCVYVQNIADDLFAIITKSLGQFQTKQGTIFLHGFDH